MKKATIMLTVLASAIACYGQVTGLSVASGAGDMQLPIGKAVPIGLTATYQDGHTEDVSADASYTYEWEDLLDITDGKATGLRDGKADVKATYTDGDGTSHELTFTVSSTYFPFDAQYITNVWEQTNTYYPETRGFKLAPYGQMGWEYDPSVNFSRYKYLVLTLDEPQTCDGDLRIYTQTSIWGGSCFIRKFGNATRIIVDLHEANYTDGDDKGEPLNLANIYKVVFWSNGSSTIDVADMYLTSRSDYARENGTETGEDIVETPQTSGKGMTAHNPISPFQFCADPTAVVYDGRVYVYGTNDHQQFNISGYDEANNYGSINTLVCMSSADMVNWTMHAPVDVKGVAPWTTCSWAPSICSKKGADGVTRFYLYFANGGNGIGVLTSESPTGPWTDPLGKVFIGHGHPGMGQVVWLFDPGVVVDENGDGWLSWGGGDRPNDVGNNLIDGNTRIAKLGDDMISFASDIMVLPAPYHFEASELNIIGGKYVYTYCSNWSSDRSQWGDFDLYDHSKAKPSAPGGAQMCYMTTTDPLDPTKWEYVGAYLDHPGGNNHTHLQKFGDQYYLFYHSEKLSRALNGDGKGYRSIGVDPINVDEANCRIPKISMTNAGPKQLTRKRINVAYPQQAETMWNGAAINVRTTGAGAPSQIWVTPKKGGAWTAVKNVYTDDQMHSFRARLRGKGKLEVRVNSLEGTPIAAIEFDSSDFQDYATKLSQAMTGENTLYFVFTEVSSDTGFDEWQFYINEDASIANPEVGACVSNVEYYTLSGMSATADTKGLCIKRTTYTDGSVTTEKRANR